MTEEHMYEMFTEASAQKIWPAGVIILSTYHKQELKLHHNRRTSDYKSILGMTGGERALTKMHTCHIQCSWRKTRKQQQKKLVLTLLVFTLLQLSMTEPEPNTNAKATGNNSTTEHSESNTQSCIARQSIQQGTEFSTRERERAKFRGRDNNTWRRKSCDTNQISVTEANNLPQLQSNYWTLDNT